MKKVHDKALLSGKDEVSCYHRYKFDMEYDSIIKTAYGENPFPETPAKALWFALHWSSRHQGQAK